MGTDMRRGKGGQRPTEGWREREREMERKKTPSDGVNEGNGWVRVKEESGHRCQCRIGGTLKIRSHLIDKNASELKADCLWRDECRVKHQLHHPFMSLSVSFLGSLALSFPLWSSYGQSICTSLPPSLFPCSLFLTTSFSLLLMYFSWPLRHTALQTATRRVEHLYNWLIQK